MNAVWIFAGRKQVALLCDELCDEHIEHCKLTNLCKIERLLFVEQQHEQWRLASRYDACSDEYDTVKHRVDLQCALVGSNLCFFQNGSKAVPQALEALQEVPNDPVSHQHILKHDANDESLALELILAKSLLERMRLLRR